MSRKDTQFKPGIIPWNKGLTKETDKRMLRVSLKMTGKGNHRFATRASKETLDKMSAAHKKKWTKEMTKDEFYLHLAEEISRQSPCLKGNWGTVLVRNDMVIGVGYNGPARGVVHCTSCRREGYPPGQGYDRCFACHSEINALLQAGGRERCLGATLYLDSHNRKPGSGGAYNSAMGFFPCDNCFRYIINAGIAAVVIRGMDLNPLWITVSSAVAQLNKKLCQKEA